MVCLAEQNETKGWCVITPDLKLLESNLQSEIRLALSDYGLVFRTNAGEAWQGVTEYDPQRHQKILTNIRPVKLLAPGFSDLLYVGLNRVAFIEVKRPAHITPSGKSVPAGTLRPDQSNFLYRVGQLGHIAGVAYSVEDALRLIEPIKPPNPNPQK